MTDKQIEYMVNRFLGWHLPDDFSPDAGISFKPTFNDHLPIPMRYNPTGTNLLSAMQAWEMVKYMIDGMPKDSAPPSTTQGMSEESGEPSDLFGAFIRMFAYAAKRHHAEHCPTLRNPDYVCTCGWDDMMCKGTRWKTMFIQGQS